MLLLLAQYIGQRQTGWMVGFYSSRSQLLILLCNRIIHFLLMFCL